MQITPEEYRYIEQYRALREENKKRFVVNKTNGLLITRFRRFIIGHKPDNCFHIPTSKGF